MDGYKEKGGLTPLDRSKNELFSLACACPFLFATILTISDSNKETTIIIIHTVWRIKTYLSFWTCDQDCCNIGWREKQPNHICLYLLTQFISTGEKNIFTLLWFIFSGRDQLSNSNKEREEKVKRMREQQEEERRRKLEELKQHVSRGAKDRIPKLLSLHVFFSLYPPRKHKYALFKNYQNQTFWCSFLTAQAWRVASSKRI